MSHRPTALDAPFRRFINRLPVCQDGVVLAFMALVGRDKFQPTMPMRTVVPFHEVLYPGACFLQIIEWFSWISQCVFQGTEQAFLTRVAACSADSLSYTSQPTILRL